MVHRIRPIHLPGNPKLTPHPRRAPAIATLRALAWSRPASPSLLEIRGVDPGTAGGRELAGARLLLERGAREEGERMLERGRAPGSSGSPGMGSAGPS